LQQLPPVFSALKIDGQSAYTLAREGKEVRLNPRSIVIKEFEITKIQLPEVHFRVHCSKGTYIRSLANDFGAALQCGGYLKELRRTKVGEHHINQAWDIDEFTKMLRSDNSFEKSVVES
jgi:tRNA pseudouridine55 synthase